MEQKARNNKDLKAEKQRLEKQVELLAEQLQAYEKREKQAQLLLEQSKTQRQLASNQEETAKNKANTLNNEVLHQLAGKTPSLIGSHLPAWRNQQRLAEELRAVTRRWSQAQEKQKLIFARLRKQRINLAQKLASLREKVACFDNLINIRAKRRDKRLSSAKKDTSKLLNNLQLEAAQTKAVDYVVNPLEKMKE